MKKRIFDLALTIPALFVLVPVIVVLVVLLPSQWERAYSFIKTGRDCAADLLPFINFGL